MRISMFCLLAFLPYEIHYVKEKYRLFSLVKSDCQSNQSDKIFLIAYHSKYLEKFKKNVILALTFNFDAL